MFPRLDIGIGREGYGKVNGGRGIHVDNITRLISILAYVDENPTMVGGEHRLYGMTGYEPVLGKVYPPVRNTIVASLQSNYAYHDVNPVSSIRGVRKAFYMAITCSAEIWRPHSDRRLQRFTQNRYRATGVERQMQRLTRFAKNVIGA